MMRDEVIEHLKETADYFRECRMNSSFASKDENHFWEMQNTVNELIGLLKEKEAVPTRVNTNYEQHWNCGNCGAVINPSDKYCHECGQKVKRE